MYFAFPMLVAACFWLMALMTGIKSVPLNAVLIALVLSYVTVTLGRRIGFLPSREIHLGFVPVLIVIWTTFAIPALPYLSPWMTSSKGRVPITFVMPKSELEKYNIGDAPSEVQRQLRQAASLNGQQLDVPSAEQLRVRRESEHKPPNQ